MSNVYKSSLLIWNQFYFVTFAINVVLTYDLYTLLKCVTYFLHLFLPPV